MKSYEWLGKCQSTIATSCKKIRYPDCIVLLASQRVEILFREKINNGKSTNAVVTDQTFGSVKLFARTSTVWFPQMTEKKSAEHKTFFSLQNNNFQHLQFSFFISLVRCRLVQEKEHQLICSVWAEQ